MLELFEWGIIGGLLLVSLGLLGLAVHWDCKERSEEILGYLLRGIVVLSLSSGLYLFFS